MSKKRHWQLPGALAILGVIALIAAACGSAGASTTTPAASATAGSQTAAVVIRNFAYVPQKITVNVGATVTWTNTDSVQHTVTSADGLGTNASVTPLFDSGLLGTGQTFSHTFTKPGTYFYECTIHHTLPAMHGEVIVK
jgi:plastocyanin